MPAYIINAKDVEALAQKVIRDHRPNLGILKFQFIFRPEAAVSDDKVIGGMCIRVDDRNWAIHGHDFIIEIAKDLWDDASDEFKFALVDHELGHAGIRQDADGQPEMDEKSGRIKTYCRKHDIEEFEDVLERHGAYHKALRTFLSKWAGAKKNKKGGEIDE